MPEPRRAFVTPRGRLFARTWLGTAICSLAIVTFVCGFSGFEWQYAAPSVENAEPETDAPARNDWSIPLFKAIQLFLLNSEAEDDSAHPSNWLLAVARLSAAGLFLLVSSTVIVRVVDEVRRLPRQLTQSDHVVICGLGQIGLQLLDDLNDRGKRWNIVVIEQNPANPWLDYARSRGASIVIGDCTKANVLNEARAAHASEIFVVNGDDGINLEFAAEMGVLADKRPQGKKPLQLYVHVVDTNLASTLRPYCPSLHSTGQMQVDVFNVPRTAAAQLVTRQLWPFAPKSRHEVAHFVILGFGPMGQALAVQLAQLGHFPNCKRSRFTIADEDIAGTARNFLHRFSRFTSWTETDLGVKAFAPDADDWAWKDHPLPAGLRVPHDEAIQYVCNAEFIDLPGGCADECFAGRLVERFSAPGVKPGVFVCGREDRENFDAAVQLRDTLTNLGRGDIPIFVWLPRQPALAEALLRQEKVKPACERLFFPFGECRSAASYQEITDPMREVIGQKIHEDYERRTVARGEKTSPEPWSQSRDDFRESNRIAADHMEIKLAVLGLRLIDKAGTGGPVEEFGSIKRADLQLLGEMEHYRWVAERLLSGWRYAPEGVTPDETQANKRRKLNPTIVPWPRLLADRQKDFEQVKAVLRECQKERFCVERIPATEL